MRLCVSSRGQTNNTVDGNTPNTFPRLSQSLNTTDAHPHLNKRNYTAGSQTKRDEGGTSKSDD